MASEMNQPDPVPIPPEAAKDLANRVRHELMMITGRPYVNTTVTCEKCWHNAVCEFAWDHYNTNGDCLAIK